jgi:hypothetical protein
MHHANQQIHYTCLNAIAIARAAPKSRRGKVSVKSVVRILSVLFVASLCHARTPLPLGNVSLVSEISCPSWAVAGLACYEATVSCPGTADVGVTYAVSPAISTKGTVVFLAGTNVNLPSNYNNDYINAYEGSGYGIAEFNWNSQWEDTGGVAKNILTASCRPATMLQYVHDKIYTGGNFLAQGFSAGSGAVAYALAWYGLNKVLNGVELLSGPVYSRIDDGCIVPYVPLVSVIPTNGAVFEDAPQYFEPAQRITMVTGFTCLPSFDTSIAAADAWYANSIVQLDGLYRYPKTKISAWVCNNGMNPSAAQGYLFMAAVTSPWKLTAISNCQGAEGVGQGLTPQGMKGAQAIIADLKSF